MEDSEELKLNMYTYWNFLPETILLQIFQYLSPKNLLTVGLTCKTWLRVSRDELLWKAFFYSYFQIDSKITIFPGKHSWLQEFKRLTYHTPLVETEVLTQHSHQVLHVSFSHNGKLFTTCSKDATVVVWDAGYPAKVKFRKEMNVFWWKYTQYSQFNESDTLLLVSGVHLGTHLSTSGEIAVFSLKDGFNLQCRIVNKPYDIFGTWYSDQYLLSGDLYGSTHFVSISVLWLNKPSQETSSEHVPIMSHLYRFYNSNASSVRAVMIANCLTSENEKDIEINSQCENSATTRPKGLRSSHTQDEHSEKSIVESNLAHNFDKAHHCFTSDEVSFKAEGSIENSEYASPINYYQEYRKVETESLFGNSSYEFRGNMFDSSSSSINDVENHSEGTEESESIGNISEDEESNPEKLLIFTTGSKTFTPHQIGIKKIKPINFPKRIDPGLSLAERIAERKNAQSLPELEHDYLYFDKFDKIDDLIDLNGHIIGMSLSPDQRYLYVNSRPWPEGCVIQNPLDPPPIAQEIDIHVIDLVTRKEVGTMLRSHKAYTPNNECFFIFLCVSNEYVASGAEDKHGYLWDRHYGVCLAKYPHNDVVNAVAFNPSSSEMLVTTSDDYTIKIWRSRNMINKLNIENKESLPRAFEVRLKNKNST